MENVKPGALYPSCLVTGGLHDPRVQYWEPAKFVAELRHQASEESGPVILKMDMESGVYLICHTIYTSYPRKNSHTLYSTVSISFSGHFSASDRYKYLRELAFDYAFLLDTLDKS